MISASESEAREDEEDETKGGERVVEYALAECHGSTFTTAGNETEANTG